ncbi:MAG: LysM peptidoglycan-binding domain-containing protein [Mesorhizobium sp.]|uniref:LysM peptidoglycan-binding domain-containing protein n=4 Tax=Mesorhizobium TaxID=68287 RepID=UPI000FCC6694|nr:MULTISPECIES: LysM peptidoglycan-binding domain-containing protein [unclassified Mesorhizobium]RUV77107.1 LysM peptidoglycan-binding domain-containing protein [Mesorhizobium sp. M5C.F.Cr.IN.023.01.1.1]RWF95115.1 MAG: LysM peptidoglycan-binding domain-containing protein [Mesorhizobium sp.]RWI39580.1 MAG: LysM peptidoglycan-binding domain-containing protein [Mesorhizobium sp.]RWI61482.1 MAG: LysM peptidoglycan-binding domain-containing protein [Mesorhizobium sp.]RWI72335.1 MAG: LysM peptidogl
MTINPVKALLFAVGGSVAAAGTAYVSGALDPYLNRAPPAEVASLTPPAEKPANPGTDGSVSPAPATDAMAPAAPATADAIAPTFDIVRVEIKGSIVVAGNAAPNAKVDILNGSTVLGSTVAGADGAFAIVLDDPLKPGDYTIALRSMTGNVVTPSAQTAVVSIPQSPAGQVLAMIEEPGKPSELLTVPTPEKKPEAPVGDKAAAPAAEDSAAGDPAAAAPAPGAPAATAPATAEVAPAPTPDMPVAPATPVAGPKIVVEAIEIDGNKIFVAGLADPGRKVRAYANDILLGDAKTSPDSHFLVEATRNIPVGTYTIRVDALDADGVKVVARAAVPFEREPGESVAAVAPAEQKPTTPSPAAGAPAAPVAEAPAVAATSAEIPETAAPKLEHADSAVIIRRHDTLWQISRRVYGQGMRYSTIYLANQDQIRNPDRIWPGQVFKVPEKSQEGEAANLKAMGDQMTTAPTKAD